MKSIALFVPCYMNQLYANAAIASLTLLEQLGYDVFYPENQTCCGQPMANSGYEQFAQQCDKNNLKQLQHVDHIVVLSGSCALHLKTHVGDIAHKVFELSEFLIDVAGMKTTDAYFPHKVALHQSCHGLRGLHLAKMTEKMKPHFSKPLALLKMVRGIEIVELERPDDCCGFGGTFSIFEKTLSIKMGKDRLQDHIAHQAAYITSVDMSCLMHLESIINAQQLNLKVKYIAELLITKNEN